MEPWSWPARWAPRWFSTLLSITERSAIGRSTTCPSPGPGNCIWMPTNGWTSNWWRLSRPCPTNPNTPAIFVPRYLRFLGRVMRHGGMSPTWHLRLFRTGVGRCENRKYDQHFLLRAGTSGQVAGLMIDDVRMPLTEWTARHNRWADGEVAEMDAEETSGRLQPDALGNPAQRKRFLRQKYDRMPLFVRPFASVRLPLFLPSWISRRNRGTHLLGSANFLVPLPGRRQDLGEAPRRESGREDICLVSVR